MPIDLDRWRRKFADAAANLPTTPAEARAEQERVLELKDGITQGEWEIRPDGKYMLIAVAGKPSVESVAEGVTRFADALLITQAPDLTTDLIAAYGFIATLLEEQKKMRTALEHIGSLARRTEQAALREFAEAGHRATTTYDELMDEYETLKRPSEIALRALATAPAGGESL